MESSYNVSVFITFFEKVELYSTLMIHVGFSITTGPIHYFNDLREASTTTRLSINFFNCSIVLPCENC